MSLQPFVSLYRYALTPLAPFTWFGVKLGALHLLAAFRVCYILRHARERLRNEHAQRRATDTKLPPAEDRSFVRDVLVVLIVVYGGEALAAPFLGVPSSFMFSGVGPLLYIFAQAIVDVLPALPPMTAHSELALSFLDGHSRGLLVCTLALPPVLTHPLPAVSESPWALLLASFLNTNAGFFFINLFSLMHPTPLTLATPAEILPYGWTMTDLWSAPLVTGVYATLTHAQPFWADLHAVLAGTDKIDPVDPETARAACALILVALFANRTARKFGLIGKQGAAAKIKTN